MHLLLGLWVGSLCASRQRTLVCNEKAGSVTRLQTCSCCRETGKSFQHYTKAHPSSRVQELSANFIRPFFFQLLTQTRHVRSELHLYPIPFYLSALENTMPHGRKTTMETKKQETNQHFLYLFCCCWLKWGNKFYLKWNEVAKTQRCSKVETAGYNTAVSRQQNNKITKC